MIMGIAFIAMLCLSDCMIRPEEYIQNTSELLVYRSSNVLATMANISFLFDRDGPSTRSDNSTVDRGEQTSNM